MDAFREGFSALYGGTLTTRYVQKEKILDKIPPFGRVAGAGGVCLVGAHEAQPYMDLLL